MITEELKICGMCAVAKPKSEFHKSKATKDGLVHKCKSCQKAYIAEYYRKNADVYREKGIEYRTANREVVLERKRQYYERNRETRLAASSQWQRDNPDKVAIRNKKWSDKNPEKVRDKSDRYRARKFDATIVPFTPEKLAEKWAYWGNKCWVCSEEATATDHVKPLAKGGAHMLCNLRPICKPCNGSKAANWPLAEWLAKWLDRKQIVSI